MYASDKKEKVSSLTMKISRRVDILWIEEFIEIYRNFQEISICMNSN